MRVVAFLQARISSTRLPGKVLKTVHGKPMLLQQIERIQRSVKIDKIVVLTSNDESDDPIEDLCGKYNIDCFRGSLHDVLDRFFNAMNLYSPDLIVRITGDCPLIDWNVIDYVINSHSLENDYVSNTLKPTYPDGLDVEVFTPSCLKKMHEKARKKIEKEHVTYYCYTHNKDFSLKNVENPMGDISYERWTVDVQEDLEFVRTIYDCLYEKNPHFIMQDVVSLLNEKPEIRLINANHERNEGLNRDIGY